MSKAERIANWFPCRVFIARCGKLRGSSKHQPLFLLALPQTVSLLHWPRLSRSITARSNERVLGKEHPNTLTSVNNLAEAQPFHNRVLEAQERVLGRRMLALIDKSKVHSAFWAPFIVVGERATTVVIVRFSQGGPD